MGGGDEGADPDDWKEPGVVLVTLEGEADEEGETKFPLNPGAFDGSMTGVASNSFTVIPG